MIFIWLSPAMKKLLEKLYFEFQHALNFSCIWHKEASYCQRNIVTFWLNLAYMVNLFVVSLDITVTINILQ